MLGLVPAMTAFKQARLVVAEASVVIVLLFSSAITILFAAEIPQNERRSGTVFMSRDTQAMQEDDRANPGMLAVLDGEALWNEAPAGAKSCAGCHGDATTAMKGVAARY